MLAVHYCKAARWQHKFKTKTLSIYFAFRFLTLASICPGCNLVCCEDSLPEIMFLLQPQVCTDGLLEQRWAACGTDQLAWGSSCSSPFDSDCHLKAALDDWELAEMSFEFRLLFLQSISFNQCLAVWDQISPQCFIILGCLPQLLVWFHKIC